MGARQRAGQRINYSNRKDNTKVSHWMWLGAAGIALFLFLFPYNRGLFNGYEISFESPLYGASIYIGVLMLATAGYLFRNWKLNSYQGLLSIAVLALPLLYWISSFQAVAIHHANLMVIIYTVLAGLFITGLYLTESKLARLTSESAFMAAGYVIVIYGLFNLFGQIYYQHAVWLAHDGYRLTSVFQYSNTYAGFLIALFLMSLYYAVHSNRLWIQLLHAAMLVPIWVSFMLTYSRGAIVIIPVIVLIVLPFLRLSKQIAYMLYMGLSILISMLLLSKLAANANAIADIVQPTETKPPGTISLFSAMPLESWGLLLLGSAITATLAWLYGAKASNWVEVKLEKLSNRKWSMIAIPAVVIVLSIAVAGVLLGSSAVRGLLPDQLSSRLENLNFQQHSVLERITFYKDGLKVAQDYPLIGGGGGAWQAMYEQYQNNPYESRQAHSFFIQVLVETGWLGLIALIVLLGFIYFLYIRSYIRFPELRGSHLIFFIMSLTLLMHSAIDFDMSYLYISALVFLSLGCMLAPYGSKLLIPQLEKMSSKSWLSVSYSGLLALVAIVVLIVSIQQNSAVKNYTKTVTLAMEQRTSIDDLLNSLDKSIKASPKQTAFTLMKADWLSQIYTQSNEPAHLEQALETIAQAKKYDPYNRGLFSVQLKLLQASNQLEESLPVIEETLVKFPWDISFYETAMTNYAGLRKHALAAADTALADQYKQRMLEISDEISRRIDLLATLPEEQQQGRSFDYTDAIKQALDSLNNE